MAKMAAAHEPGNTHEDLIRQWADTEFKAGRGAKPEQAVELILRLAAGDADALSGRHLSVHDDLDAVMAHVAEVRDQDLYVMRPERLPAGPHTIRASASPAYLRGRPAATWQAALRPQQHAA